MYMTAQGRDAIQIPYKDKPHISTAAEAGSSWKWDTLKNLGNKIVREAIFVERNHVKKIS